MAGVGLDLILLKQAAGGLGRGEATGFLELAPPFDRPSLDSWEFSFEALVETGVSVLAEAVRKPDAQHTGRDGAVRVLEGDIAICAGFGHTSSMTLREDRIARCGSRVLTGTVPCSRSIVDSVRVVTIRKSIPWSMLVVGTTLEPVG